MELEDKIRQLTPQMRKEVEEFIDDSEGYEKLLPSIEQYKRQLKQANEQALPYQKRLEYLVEKFQDRIKYIVDWQIYDESNPPIHNDDLFIIQTTDGHYDIIDCIGLGVQMRKVMFAVRSVKLYCIIQPPNSKV